MVKEGWHIGEAHVIPNYNILHVERLEHYAGPDEWEPSHKGDAGLDLYAADYVQILPGDWKLVRCGVKIALPRGTEAQVRPRSGRALKEGMVVLNSPGTIDEAYRGEVMVIVHNINPTVTTEDLLELMSIPGPNLPGDVENAVRQSHSLTSKDLSDRMWTRLRQKTLAIKPGDKIAQLVIAEYKRPPVVYVRSVDDTERGADGFGSTG